MTDQELREQAIRDVARELVFIGDDHLNGYVTNEYAVEQRTLVLKLQRDEKQADRDYCLAAISVLSVEDIQKLTSKVLELRALAAIDQEKELIK